MNPAVQRYQEEKLRPSQPDPQAMIQSYLPLVRRVAHRLARELPPGIDVNDLISAGCVGMLLAAKRFDPSRGLSFGSFAEFRIKGAILDELRELDPVPRRSRRKIREMERARRRLTGELGRPPEAEEMAQRLEMSLDDYNSAEVSLTPGVEFSLSLLEHGKASLHLSTQSSCAPPDQILQRTELRKLLARAIRSLPERLRSVIALYYYAKLNYKEIALLFDVTESRVCQLHRDAVGHLRASLEDDKR